MSDTAKIDWTPLNLKAALQNHFHTCGCTDTDAVRTTLLRILRWHGEQARRRHAELWPEEGVFYLLAGLLDAGGFAMHGTSVRGAFLTEDGKRFLAALELHNGDAIDAAEGTAYDGLYYPSLGGAGG